MNRIARWSLIVCAALLLALPSFAANTWKKQASPTTKVYFGLDMINTITGVAVGADSSIIKTTDGGLTWASQTVGGASDDYDILAVAMADASVGYAVGSDETGSSGGIFWKTENGGANWTLNGSGGNNGASWTDISCVNSLEVWYCANSACSFRVNYSSNGGNTWTDWTFGLANFNFYGIHAFNSSNVWLVGEGGKIYFTNGSGSWTSQTSGVETVDLKDVYFINSTTGWACGGDKVVRTTNSGTNWSQATVTSGRTGSIYLESVHFRDANNGLVAGRVSSASYIARSTDGGATWTEETSYLGSLPLYGIRDISATSALAVGGNSSLLLRYSTDPSVTNVLLDGRNDRPVGYTGIITIEGASFSTSSTVSATGLNITVTSIPTGGTRITGIATCAAAGVQTVTVYNLDGGYGSGSFTVNPLPAISSADPSEMAQGASGAVVIAGSGFLSGLTTSDIVFSGAGVTVNSLNRDSQYQLTLGVEVAAGAAAGPRDITVNNPDGGSGTGSDIFSVTPAGVANPTVISVSPDSATQGAAALNVTITGTGFQAPPTVSFGNNGVTINSVVFNSSTSLTANLTLSPTATVGSRNVRVTNPDLGSGSKADAFRVLAPGTVDPTFTSMVDDFLYAGTSKIMYVTGTGFQSGLVVSVDPANRVLVQNIQYLSPTNFRLTLSAEANAQLGTRDLTINNPDGGQAVVANGLNIKPRVNPAELSAPIPIYSYPNPWNYNTNPNVTLQFEWPHTPAQVTLLVMGEGGRLVKPPFQINIVTGRNNIVMDALSQLGHHLGTGLYSIKIIYNGKVVAQGYQAIHL